MTNNELIKYLTPLAKKAGVDSADLSEFLDSCVKLAIIDAWTASNWECRTKESTLAVTSSITTLPNDFAKYRSIRQRTTQEGMRLYYYPKVEFDRMYPKPDAHPTGGYPQSFTIYKDASNWKIIIMPVPSSITLYIEYYTKAPATLDKLDDQVIPVAVASAIKYASGVIDFTTELKRAEVLDGPVGDLGGRFLDGSDEPQQVIWAWQEN